jgi:glycine dehydrogenase subunit 2
MMPEKSIGRLRTFYGNFGILLRAYVYLLFHGPEGIRQNSTQAVVNANYLMKKLKNILPTAYQGFCMHEFVCPNPVEKLGIHTMDIAKRLLDYGIHAPTVYFPLIVKEALMIEPTESESLAQLDEFVEVMTQIIEEAKNTPERLTGSPSELPLKRLDEVRANKKPVFRHRL